jgi:hypothetical protein
VARASPGPVSVPPVRACAGPRLPPQVHRPGTLARVAARPGLRQRAGSQDGRGRQDGAGRGDAGIPTLPARPGLRARVGTGRWPAGQGMENTR